MAGDGNCLFRGVAEQVYGDQDLCDQVRLQTVQLIASDRDRYSQFVVGEDFEDYVKRMKRNGEHGGHLEIQAMAELYCRQVQVFTIQQGPVNIFHSRAARQSSGKDHLPIRLLYVQGSHYDSIIDITRPSFGAGLGLPGLQVPEKGIEVQVTENTIAQSAIEDVDDQILKQVLQETNVDIEEQMIKQAMAESVNVDDELMQLAIMESLRQANNNGGSN